MTRKNLGPQEAAKLDAIEALVTSLREDAGKPVESLSSRSADRVARLVGSWRFLLGQGGILLGYIFLNAKLLTGDAAFDPYPFILLNLFLSFQAAFTAPIILMAQNRTDANDRKHANRAYRTIGHIEELVKVLAELEGVEIPQPESSSSSSTENGSE
jgi:uncharacterized membrane protein